MRPIVPYLTLPGTCAEAMAFYADLLGGEVVVSTTYGEAPVEVPEADPDHVFNSVLVAGDLELRASDGPGDGASSSVSLFLTLDDGDAMTDVLDRLEADGGRELFPRSPGFGMAQDRFGTRWMTTVADH